MMSVNLVKKLLRLAILKFENRNFTAIKIQFFKKEVYIDNILVSNTISLNEKNYKYFIGYIEHCKIKPFSIIFPKTSAYLKMVKLNEYIF